MFPNQHCYVNQLSCHYSIPSVIVKFGIVVSFKVSPSIMNLNNRSNQLTSCSQAKQEAAPHLDINNTKYYVLSTPNNTVSALSFLRAWLAKMQVFTWSRSAEFVPKVPLFLTSFEFYRGVLLTQMYSILCTTNYWGTHTLNNKQLWTKFCPVFSNCVDQGFLASTFRLVQDYN